MIIPIYSLTSLTYICFLFFPTHSSNFWNFVVSIVGEKWNTNVVFFKINFYWSVVDLQHCVSFCSTEK